MYRSNGRTTGRSTRRTVFLPVTAAVLALAAAGCSNGSDATRSSAAATSPAAPSPSPFVGDSARQVLAKARDAADGATSVHVKGTINESGQKMAINMKLKYGTGAYGYLKVGKDTLAIRRIGKTVYMKGSDAFWKKSAPGSEKLFGGNWISGDYKSPAFAAFAVFTNKQLVTGLLKPSGKVTRTAGKDVGGVATVGLKDNAKADSGTLYISAADKAYPLLLVATDKSSTIALSEWDQPVTVVKPAGSINIDKLSA